MIKDLNVSNKKKFCFLACLVEIVTLSAASIYCVVTSNTSKTSADVGECTHDGRHYSAKEPYYGQTGNIEFWACCKCYKAYTVNPGGTWIDYKEGYPGTLPSDHVAYIASWIPVDTVIINNGDDITVKAGSDPFTFAFAVSPSGAHYDSKKTEWYLRETNPEACAIIQQNGYFTPVEVGTTQVWVEVKSYETKTSFITVTIE